MGLFQFLRQYRVGEYAIFDTALSFIAVYFLAPLLTKLFRKIGINIPRWNWLYLTLPISVVVHGILGIYTPLTHNFFDPSGHWIVKLVVILLLVLGVKDIRLLKKGKSRK